MSLRSTTLEIAVSYIGTHELERNSGPEVDLFLSSIGLNPGYPWCQAFLYYCAMRAAALLKVPNPLPRTGSTLRAWRMAQPYMRDSNPAPGYIWILQHGQTTGHAGIVESIDDNGVITSISGNTNESGSREGNAVARKTGQPEVIHGGTLLGYLDVDRGWTPPDDPQVS